MNLEVDYLARVARPGTDLYYSLLFLSKERQEAATALYAYQREIINISLECSEISVAHTKLQWWREEIDRLFLGNPRHPITQSLVTATRQYQLSQPLFLSVIEAATRDLYLVQSLYPTLKALIYYCEGISGSISMLIAQICGYTHTETQKYANTLGVALHLYYLLRNTRQYADKGFLHIPQDQLMSFKVSTKDIFNGYNPTGQVNLFTYQINLIHQYFKDSLSYLNKGDYISQQIGLIQISLSLATLNAIKEDGYLLLEKKTSLTPLHKLWLAWLTSKRARWGLVPKC
ncbi:squalene/phytoene synthase family protein [Candidatus Nitrosacidococcus sp. I8]|uniref:squalene/phytoene synthase family protein n=1 Tax=Candidatus Nitrosacidococcus sp. I8 TaxID=2942908 RepID=UPI0022264040|nr:squalene/phytoene synthase family protein [Candidatus Nitrosacidococcus sp. I8]CAH9019549.1 15-cis-phytoene synthase [Candidatus Nitrosacidococcus sp. I8]